MIIKVEVDGEVLNIPTSAKTLGEFDTADLRSNINTPSRAVAYVNGEREGFDYELEAGDTVKFQVEASSKS
tara:strand:+ start:210 stop:422 length:213 start_codon:yes stop_codon:yes gene_type:complete